MKNFFFLLLMAGMTTLISCAKEGERGPAGLDGQDGINGTNGINGQDGQNGQDGSSNVKSTTITVVSSLWSSTGSQGQAFLYLNVPIITADVANGGMVMVYSQAFNSNEWKAWPYTVAYVQYRESFSFSFVTGEITLVDTSDDGNPIKPGGQFRIVALTSFGRACHPDLDWTNYEDVSKALQLAE